MAFGPPGCFSGEPKTPAEFASQCTTAHAERFDNCKLVSPCNDDTVNALFNIQNSPPAQGPPPAPPAQIAPIENCGDIPARRIYVTGSTNFPPLVGAVQKVFYADPDHSVLPYVVVFAPQTSCKGVEAIYSADASKHMIFNIVDNYAFYYKDAGNGTVTQTFCKLSAAGDVVDVGESDIYPSSCGADELKANITDKTGPIQAITFVVPAGSSQTAISAAAAHLVFGAGGGQGMPWTDYRLYFVRSSGTGTTQLPARAISVSPTAWWGIDRLSAKNLVDSMKALDAKDAEAAIGILSSDFADKDRDNLKELAFQQRDQNWAYLPDSTRLRSDKVNVRDGHYPIWGAIHLMAANQNGVPSPAASALINALTVPRLDQSVVSAIIEAGYIPPCAMKVTRSTELGPLQPSRPSFACGCFFDKETGGTPSCKACTVAGDCGTGESCNYGYCEKS